MSEYKSPEWWDRAVELERANKLKEAEALLKESIPHLAFASQTAELYRLRMIRLMSINDMTGAREAHKQAHDWIYTYASMATSGGEGAALSLQRDDFLKELGPSPVA